LWQFETFCSISIQTLKCCRCHYCSVRPIYTVRFCRMRYAYAMPTTRIVSCKLAFSCRRADLDGTIFPYDCSLRLAHVMSTTRIVSSKSDLLHVHDSHTQHEKCRRILKHVLKPYDSRSQNQNVKMTSSIRSLPDTSSALLKSHTTVASKNRTL